MTRLVSIPIEITSLLPQHLEYLIEEGLGSHKNRVGVQMIQVISRSESLMVFRKRDAGGDEITFGDYPSQSDLPAFNKVMESGVTTSIL